LALGEFGDRVIQFLAQGWVARVDPGQGGGVKPLAHMFAVPTLTPRPLTVTLQQAIDVDLYEPVGFVGLDPGAEPTGQLQLVGLHKTLAICHRAGDFFGHWSDRRRK
jgi:hypothetical protein